MVPSALDLKSCSISMKAVLLFSFLGRATQAVFTPEPTRLPTAFPTRVPTKSPTYAPTEYTYCTRSDLCWPSNLEINALAKILNTTATNRTMSWGNPGTPPPAPLLYNVTAFMGIKPLYAADPVLTNDASCFQSSSPVNQSIVCEMSARNIPYFNWNVAFITWPLTSAHVKAIVNFARQHDLCIMVAGSGSDTMNRHSCENGLMIRTLLLKSVRWDLTDFSGFGSRAGSVKLGAGVLWGEAQKSANSVNRVLSGAWHPTVGVVGFSLGGGHGPLAPSLGLGSDNILEVEIVSASGTLLTCNGKTFNSQKDLFWALQGGGGSTWGVIVSITIKAHFPPNDGFTAVAAHWQDNTCPLGLARRQTLLSGLQNWFLSASSRWGGVVALSQDSNKSQPNCYLKMWTADALYVFTGNGTSDPDFQALAVAFAQTPPSVLMNTSDSLWTLMSTWPLPEGYGLQREGSLELTFDPSDAEFLKGEPSALVGKNWLLSPTKFLTATTHYLDQTMADETIFLYHDLTGNVGSPRLQSTSISSALRNSTLNVKLGFLAFRPISEQAIVDNLFSDSSFFSESSYHFDSFYELNDNSWTSRYWGSNYKRLQTIKTKYDPNNVFACHHCIIATPAQPTNKTTNNSPSLWDELLSKLGR